MLPGIVASHPEVDEFVRLWAATHSIEPEVLREQGVYALERVKPRPPAQGSSRVATHEDAELLLDWMVAFGLEVLHDGRSRPHGGPSRSSSTASAPKMGASCSGRTTARSSRVSGWGGPTPNGIRIGPVYTPPRLRGRGYASAVVAELSQTLLDRGRRFCFLFTDLANPTSNAIYERIGYVRVC